MEHTRLVLQNGLQLVHVPMPAMRSISVAVFIGLGSRYEDDRHAGVSHLIEHMLFKGTERRHSARDISEAIESVGGMLNASTDRELTAYWAKVAAEHLPLAVDLLADMLQSSRLSSADLVREKAVVLEELAMLADDPQELVHVLTDEALWPRQAIGREIAGTRESVKSLRRGDLQRFLRTFYGTDNAVISFAGGVDLETCRSLAETHFGNWRSSARTEPYPALPADGEPRRRLEYRPIGQLNLCLAFPTVPRLHPDRWPLDVLASILGGGTSSRLFVALRERLGLAYDVHAYTTHLSDAGSLVVYGAGERTKAGRILDGILRQIDRLQQRRVPPAELRKVKQYFRGRLWLSLEDSQAVASWFGAQVMLNGAIATPEEVAALVDNVSAADVQRVARDYLRPEVARLAAVGPASDPELAHRLDLEPAVPVGA